MMFKRRKSRDQDPFRLSVLGRCQAGIAWLRGPILLRRWLLLTLGAAVAVAVGGVIVIAVVMQAASPAETGRASESPAKDVASMLRAGPASSRVTDLPGYDCHPMPALGLKYLNPMNTGPSVVAVDRDGVVWGPACVVTYGIAG